MPYMLFEMFLVSLKNILWTSFQAKKIQFYVIILFLFKS